MREGAVPVRQRTPQRTSSPLPGLWTCGCEGDLWRLGRILSRNEGLTRICASETDLRTGKSESSDRGLLGSIALGVRMTA